MLYFYGNIGVSVC